MPSTPWHLPWLRVHLYAARTPDDPRELARLARGEALPSPDTVEVTMTTARLALAAAMLFTRRCG